MFVAAVKLYYQFLLEHGYRNDNPARLIKLGSRKEHFVQFQELLTRDELEELLTSRENRYNDTIERNQVIISFLIYQGLTSQEITNIKVDDIDLDACTVKIRKTAMNKKRVMGLKPKQIMPLTKYMEIRDDLNRYSHKSLLMSTRNQPYTVDAINRMLGQLKHLIPGKKVNATTIRQSVIANWLNADKIELGDVQLLAGHRYPSSTIRYRIADPEEKRKLINNFHPLAS